MACRESAQPSAGVLIHSSSGILGFEAKSDGTRRISKRSYCGLRFSGLPIATRKMALLSFACGEKKLTTSSSEEGQPGRTQVLSIRSQVDPAADGARFELDGAVAAVPVSLQNLF
jgi:hypothetical protein